MDIQNDSPAPDPWLHKLRGMIREAGEELPDDLARVAPFVFVDLPADDMARKVAEVLRGRNLLFRRGREIGTINSNGLWCAMTPSRFQTFLPVDAELIPYRKTETATGKIIKAEFSKQKLAAVLESDILINRTPEILRINRVRLPVFREAADEREKKERKGFTKIELSKEGFDAESGTWTCQSEDFPEDMPPIEAVAFLMALLKHFPFSDKDRMAALIAGMLTVFCAGMFRGRPPMFLVNANLPGSGKSRLGQLILDIVFGSAGKSGYRYDRVDEVRKELDAKAQNFAGYVFFDDLPKGKVQSEDLNRWLTAKTWECRVMGSKEMFSGPLQAITVMTGNQITLDDGIDRRTIIIDLYPRLRVGKRPLPEDAIPINDDFFEDAAMRSKILASLWSLVRHWDDSDRPGLAEFNEKPLESFEGWSRIVPPMVLHAGWGNPLVKFEAADTGDRETRDFEKMAELLIKEKCIATGNNAAYVTMSDTISVCRRLGIFSEILGGAEAVLKDLENNPRHKWRIPDGASEVTDEEKLRQAAEWSDKSIQSRWGKKLPKSAIIGQYIECGGSWWEMGTRASTGKEKFQIRRIEEAELDGGNPA
ncbi:MAG: hypothetical protein AB7I98_03820 [Verrucomicrobiales bacterium]